MITQYVFSRTIVKNSGFEHNTKERIFVYKEEPTIKIILIDIETHSENWGVFQVFSSGVEDGSPTVAIQSLKGTVIEYIFNEPSFKGWSPFVYDIYKQNLHITFVKD